MQTYGSSNSSTFIKPAYKPNPVIVSRLSPVKARIYTPALSALKSVGGTSYFICGRSPTIPTMMSSQSSSFSSLSNYSIFTILTVETAYFCFESPVREVSEFEMPSLGTDFDPTRFLILCNVCFRLCSGDIYYSTGSFICIYVIKTGRKPLVPIE